MMRINLLPVKRLRKLQRARNEIFGLLAVLGAVVGGLFVVFLLLGGKIDRLNGEIASLEAEKAKYQQTINEIEELKKQKALLETKLGVIKQLKKGSQTAMRVMDELAYLVPADKLWVNNIVLANNEVRLSGIALDNPTVASFMETVDKSPVFGYPELGAASQNVTAGRKLKAFSLTFGVTTPPVAEAEPQAAQ